MVSVGRGSHVGATMLELGQNGMCGTWQSYWCRHIGTASARCLKPGAAVTQPPLGWRGSMPIVWAMLSEGELIGERLLGCLYVKRAPPCLSCGWLGGVWGGLGWV